MYRPASLLLVVSSFLLALFAVGCNGGSSSHPPSPPSVITTSLPAAVVGTSYSFTLGAAGGSVPYTWSVSSGALPSWAQLDSGSGTIAGMPDTDGVSNFSVLVTDSAGLTDEQNLSLVVSALPTLTISTTSLPNGSVGLQYAATLRATGGTTPYTWSISSGSLPSWASLNSGGSISGTPDANGTSNFTVEVRDSQTSPASATQALSITVAAPDLTNNAKLKGQYSFLLNGFDDTTGNQFAIVGSFIADGSGGITGGVEDINGPGGYQSALSFTGKYNVGADDRGIATFESSAGSTRFALAVGSPNNDSVATRASLIEFDDVTGNDGKRGSGSVFLQTLKNFGLSDMTGPYAFQFSGQTGQTGSRQVLTGAYSADGSGNLTAGQFDANADGTMSNQSFTAKISPTAQTSSVGRVTAVATNLPTTNFVFYIVSANRALAMSTDPESTNGLLSGEILAQSSTPYAAASLNGTSVAYTVGKSVLFTGLDNTSVSGELWTFNGSGGATYSLHWLDGWWGDLEPTTWPVTYSVSANGRVTISGPTPLALPESPIFYLVSNNTGFFMTTGGSVASGFLEAQEDKPFSTASVSGNYFLGTVAPSQSCSTVTSGVGASTGNGALNVTIDTSSPEGVLTLGQSQSFTLSVNADGSGVYEQYGGFLYVISGKKIILLSPGWEDSCPTVIILKQ